MPIPFIPVITALCAGGSLVPHAAGGLIVSGASGYVAGTYLSTAAVTAILASTTAAGAAGIAATVSAIGSALSGTANSAASSVGLVSGHGLLGLAGGVLLSPASLTVLAGGACCAGVVYYRRKKRQKDFEHLLSTLRSTNGEKVFSEDEAILIESLIRRVAKHLPKPD